MLSELIGMTMGAYGSVCVSVCVHGSHHIPLCRVARCSMNRPTESRQIIQTAAD